MNETILSFLSPETGSLVVIDMFSIFSFIGTGICIILCQCSSTSTPPFSENKIISSSLWDMIAKKYSLSCSTNGSIMKFVSTPETLPISTVLPIFSLMNFFASSILAFRRTRLCFPFLPMSWSGFTTSFFVFSQECSLSSASKLVCSSTLATSSEMS